MYLYVYLLQLFFVDPQLPPDQRSLNYIRQLEAKVKELEEEKNKFYKQIIHEEKNDQKINIWNADASFPVSCYY